MTRDVILLYGHKPLRIAPHIRLVCEIEDELGSAARLQRQFAAQEWRVCDLVSIVQMMLQAAGEAVDYKTLGNKILSDGVTPYLVTVRQFLGHILDSKG